MPERHIGMHIAARLREAAMEWNIPDERVSAIVHDNAANMRVAVQELGWEDVCCFGHTLQLAINWTCICSTQQTGCSSTKANWPLQA